MKKIIASILAVVMVTIIGVSSAYAATDIGTPGGEGDTKVTLDAEAATFKVTVPTVLPYTVDSNGVVSLADNAKIINESNGPVIVTNVTAKTLDSWKLDEVGTDFQSVKVNSPEFTMTLNGDNRKRCSRNTLCNHLHNVFCKGAFVKSKTELPMRILRR